MKEIRFLYTDRFCASWKKLCKKYRSLPTDFVVLCQALKVNPTGYQPQIVPVSGLGKDISVSIYKVRKFAVKAMKQSNSGIRIVYAYDADHGQIEFIEFVEIYHKNSQENHDIEYIKKLYENIDHLPSGSAKEEL